MHTLGNHAIILHLSLFTVLQWHVATPYCPEWMDPYMFFLDILIMSFQALSETKLRLDADEHMYGLIYFLKNMGRMSETLYREVHGRICNPTFEIYEGRRWQLEDCKISLHAWIAREILPLEKDLQISNTKSTFVCWRSIACCNITHISDELYIDQCRLHEKSLLLRWENDVVYLTIIWFTSSRKIQHANWMQLWRQWLVHTTSLD